MVTAAQIGWGSYGGYEGPYWRGTNKYLLPVQPDFMDRCLSVLSATEGNYDSVNGYDRCIISIGFIQFCEAGQFSVSRLLGACADVDQFMMDQMVQKFPVIEGSGGGRTPEFQKNPQGLWRFYLAGTEIATSAQQRYLFLGDELGGKSGTWKEREKNYAKAVAAWFANIWDYPLFRTIQAQYIKQKLPGYAMPKAKQTLYQGMTRDDQQGWRGALRAAFYSFAANLPTTADNALANAVQSPSWADGDDEAKFLWALKSLTFSPNISIYLKRYEAIAPVLKRLFSVDLPLTAEDLRNSHPETVTTTLLSSIEEEVVARLSHLHDSLESGLSGMDVIDQLNKNNPQE